MSNQKSNVASQARGQALWPIIALLVGAAVSVWFFARARTHELRGTEQSMRLIAPGIADRIQLSIQNDIRPLRRLARDVAGGQIKTGEQFTAAAGAVQQQVPALTRVIWIDASSALRATSAQPDVSTMSPDDQELRDVAVRSLLPPRVQVAPGRNAERAWICAAIVRPDDSQKVLGAIIGERKLDGTPGQILTSEVRKWFDATVHDERGVLVFTTGDSRSSGDFQVTQPVPVEQSKWYLDLRPTGAFIRAQRGAGPAVILCSGLIVSVVAAWGTAQSLRYRRRVQERAAADKAAVLEHREMYQRTEEALNSQQRLVRQRDALFEVNSMIQNASSLREALDCLATRAPRALEVDACIVCLATAAPGCIEIAASSRTDTASEMLPNRVVECKVCSSVITSGEILTIEDTVEQPIRGFPDMGSALFVPLRTGTKTKGLICLLRRQTGQFATEQREIAKIFAYRAMTAIEAARLNEETRRQAETNAILLRELNHRVGNNLASIVGLLSVAADKLPEGSRQWLDRVIERVATMRRAHDLFSGGTQSIRLDELVRATLESVSAAKGTEVHIRLDLDPAASDLASNRAVTLAMVLHELAYNAIRHALSHGGELIIRGRRINDDRIAIDVIDQPASIGDVLEERAEKFSAIGDGNGGLPGIGLQLVQNLVRRELRGDFALVNGPRGGTIATIELPVESQAEIGACT